MAGPCANEIIACKLQSTTSVPACRGTKDGRRPGPSTDACFCRARKAADEQRDRAALERARAADVKGDEETCRQALSEARSPSNRRLDPV